ncbi:1649_t:CDS:2 [Entrophospora sp. SA101]|nr:6368_t:CDS:2 [Entrophospora sp. SA101]CAJ0753831.1 1649_t:CDS:2 [Entrophospora sp. SA101]CAJ0884748.1 1839_t:CDS:2 [Entrophospora sp. SA101]
MAKIKKVNEPANLLNPRTKEYEFLGPIGAFLMITFLPILMYILHLGCTVDGCPSPKYISKLINLEFFSNDDNNDHENFYSLSDFFDFKIFIIYNLYLVYLVLLWYILPGNWIEGVRLRNNKVLKYKENGFKTLIVTFTLLLISSYFWGYEFLLIISDKYIQFMTSSIIVSFMLSVFVYINSFRNDKDSVLLSLGGNSGNIIYDFMIGRELNPRIQDFDIKCFVELRPGLICWLLVNISMALKQYDELGTLTFGMLFILIFQGWYCVDSLYNEANVLTTMDITTDGFGWMLAFGNLSWLSFLYPLQSRYISLHPKDLSIFEIVLVMTLQLIGYSIFRGANNEKDLFRKNPDDEYVKSGSKLIISGWWGISRHINYLGDWLMAWAWCLTCGYDDIFPYFYVVYFGVLLIHRELRDEEKCRKKYKKDWDKYCEIVRWRIIPGVY